MITEYKIKIFKRYNGDIDNWVRNSSPKEKSIMTDSDWYDIDAFLQDLSLVKKGLTTIDFNKALISKLITNCESEGVINQLKNLANKD